MSETEQDAGLAAATARFDRAMNQLDASLRDLNARMQRHQRIEVDTQRLIHERARLATELDKTSARAKRLDDSAHEVSRRLVEAMETVRSVLQKAES
jgi:methyl-accepting chemotaxis protein